MAQIEGTHVVPHAQFAPIASSASLVAPKICPSN
jgi:hypothetical protein